jgi:hypothetical protein
MSVDAAPVAPSGPAWLYEMKHDSFRILPRKEAEILRLWSRQGRSWRRTFEQIAEAVAALPLASRRVRLRPAGKGPSWPGEISGVAPPSSREVAVQEDDDGDVRVGGFREGRPVRLAASAATSGPMV